MLSCICNNGYHLFPLSTHSTVSAYNPHSHASTKYVHFYRHPSIFVMTYQYHYQLCCRGSDLAYVFRVMNWVYSYCKSKFLTVRLGWYDKLDIVKYYKKYCYPKLKSNEGQYRRLQLIVIEVSLLITC